MCQLSQRCIIVPSPCSLGVLLTPLPLIFSPPSLRLCNCTFQWLSRHWRFPCSNLCHCHWGFVSTIEINICINVRHLGLQTSFDGILYDLLSRPFPYSYDIASRCIVLCASGGKVISCWMWPLLHCVTAGLPDSLVTFISETWSFLFVGPVIVGV